ncbi:MAG: hypothetical protein HOP19_03705 [Acidobacteria bacterium]|nr:hypothetical protein [Acidobacteriota bacterium]
MNDVLVWLHGDCLNPHGPALQAHADAPRVFVFDEALLTQYRLSLKRLAFLYECLLEIPRVEIRKGDVAAELAAAAREYDCSRIVTAESVAPRFAQIRAALQREYDLTVEVVALEPFIELSSTEAARLDLKRFSRYWNPLKARALSLNQSFDW